MGTNIPSGIHRYQNWMVYIDSIRKEFDFSFIAIVLVGFLLARGLIIYLWLKPRGIKRLLDFLIFGVEQEDIVNLIVVGQHQPILANRLAEVAIRRHKELTKWNGYLFGFFFRNVFLLLVFTTFLQVYRLSPANIQLNELNKEDLSKYNVLEGTAEEKLFKLSLRNGLRDKSLWHSKKSYLSMYDTLLRHSRNTEDSDMFGITFEPYIWYYLEEKHKCDKLFIYDTNLHSNTLFSGFYFGENVNSSLRRQIDASISRLLYSDIDNYLGVDESTRRTCGKTYRTAYWSVMFYLTLPVLVIFVLWFLAHWLRQSYRHPL